MFDFEDTELAIPIPTNIFPGRDVVEIRSLALRRDSLTGNID